MQAPAPTGSAHSFVSSISRAADSSGRRWIVSPGARAFCKVDFGLSNVRTPPPRRFRSHPNSRALSWRVREDTPSLTLRLRLRWGKQRPVSGGYTGSIHGSSALTAQSAHEGRSPNICASTQPSTRGRGTHSRPARRHADPVDAAVPAEADVRVGEASMRLRLIALVIKEFRSAPDRPTTTERQVGDQVLGHIPHTRVHPHLVGQHELVAIPMPDESPPLANHLAGDQSCAEYSVLVIEQYRCQRVEPIDIADGRQLTGLVVPLEAAPLDLVTLPLSIRGVKSLLRIRRLFPGERSAEKEFGETSGRIVCASRHPAAAKLLQDAGMQAQQLPKRNVLQFTHGLLPAPGHPARMARATTLCLPQTCYGTSAATGTARRARTSS